MHLFYYSSWFFFWSSISSSEGFFIAFRDILYDMLWQPILLFLGNERFVFVDQTLVSFGLWYGNQINAEKLPSYFYLDFESLSIQLGTFRTVILLASSKCENI